MANRPDWERLTEGATESYATLDSLASIRPPYPASGSPNWYALRRRYEELLAIRQAKLGTRWDRDSVELSDISNLTALGFEPAEARYQHANPETGLPLLESKALRTMRENDPPRYAALVAEARRLVALGRPRSGAHLAKPMP